MESLLLNYVISVLILIGALCFSHSGEAINIETVILCFVNAVIVSLASNGVYDGVTTGMEKIQEYKHEE